MAQTRHTIGFLTLSVLASAAMSACSTDDGGGSPPLMEPLSDRPARVDSEFTLEVRASDPDGDALTFGYASDIDDIGTRADLRVAGTRAVFRWTPIAADIGLHVFDFTASDGTYTATETIAIDVQPPAGTSTAPIFRKPLGTGTTLDLATKNCVAVDIVVEDSDSAGVTIGQDEPTILHSTLDQESGLSATWNWCPSTEQIAESDRHVLKLFADDGENAKTVKNYLIVLRRTLKPGCPGGAPVIEHTPQDAETVVGLTITAKVNDDVGIKYEPLFYYTTQTPTDPLDLTQMTQITMTLVDGNMKSGTWAADVPNPVVNQPVGTSAQLHYVIVTQDNDDQEGDCDHLTQAPGTGTYTMTVTNPGGSGGLGLCKTCTADSQCGGAADLCILMDDAGNSYCFRACDGPEDCTEAGYYCSITDFPSIEGKRGRQCIPESLSCTNVGPTTCQDDEWEENDSMAAARGLDPGNFTGLVSCPRPHYSSDDDYYLIAADGSGTITAGIDGGDTTDLDLSLLDESGTVVAKSDSLTSSETLSVCVPEGFYYLRVYSWQTAKNTYSLSFDFTPKACSSAPTCYDDPEEPDDNASQARPVDLAAGVFKSDTNAICAFDEDWFSVPMLASQTLHATLTFEQTAADEDLDLLLYKGATLLTPCSGSDCDPDNGQSATSNERLIWTINENATYYVVVRGWMGSENLYDICIGRNATECPAPN